MRTPPALVVVLAAPGCLPRHAALADVMVVREALGTVATTADDLFRRYPGLSAVVAVDVHAHRLGIALRGRPLLLISFHTVIEIAGGGTG